MSLAFVFPGQGSQSIGMLSELSENYPSIQETYSIASQALGYDLWQVVQNGPEEKLNQTDVTQPAMLAAGVAVWEVWQKKNGDLPQAMAGHSLGEYTALVCSGVLSLKDAIGLVADRGRFMQDAVPVGEGAMAAILGLDDDVVRDICTASAAEEVVQAVNYNSPGQVVIAGNVTAVERAVESCKKEGAKRAVVLPVSVPSHCQLMEPAAHYLAERLQNIEFNKPAVNVINNVDVQSYEEPEQIKDALVRQLCNPVRWVDTINKMDELGVDTIIECGPGKVLFGLTKRINRKFNNHSVFSPESLEKTLSALRGE